VSTFRLDPNADTPERNRANWQKLQKMIDLGLLSGGVTLPIAISDVTGLQAALDELGSAGQPAGAPAAPSDLTATAISPSRIDLEWFDNSGATETGFQVEQSADNSTWAIIHTTAADATTYSVTGLSILTQYWFRVRATGASANSAPSNVATATTNDAVYRSSFIAVPTTADRNDLPGSQGFKFTIAGPIMVTKLGRLYVTGNTEDHPVKLWEEGNTTAIASGTVLAASASDALGIKWVDITPITLPAGDYRISCNETNAGDTLKDLWTAAGLVQTDFVVVNSVAINTPGDYPSNLSGGGAGKGLSAPAMWYANL
jgi:hypothetical protein